MSYYDRQSATHLDGTPIFQTPEDQKSEEEVAVIISKHFDCEIRRFGMLSPIDWYATRHGRMIGVLELKSRTHDSGKYNTVFLNVRKWLALSLASVGLGVPAIFVVRFTDQVRWLRLSDVDATSHRMGGTTRMVKSVSDQEPVIKVVVANMKIIGET